MKAVPAVTINILNALYFPDGINQENIVLANKEITLNDGSKTNAISLGRILLQQGNTFRIVCMCSNKGVTDYGSISHSNSNNWKNETVGNSFLFFQDNQAVFTADIIAWDGVVKPKDATNSLITPMIFELVYDGSVIGYIYCEMQVV